jgi:phage terminase small subunit
MDAPKHLNAASRAWWRSVVEQYNLEQHHLRLLQLAAEAWERCQEAREVLAAEGIVLNGKTHPAIAIERDARLAFARLLRELDLDGGPEPEAPRPPLLRSNRRFR